MTPEEARTYLVLKFGLTLTKELVLCSDEFPVLQAGDVSGLCSFGEALQRSCWQGDAKKVALLLQNGIDPNLSKKKPLFNSCLGGFDNITHSLINHGAGYPPHLLKILAARGRWETADIIFGRLWVNLSLGTRKKETLEFGTWLYAPDTAASLEIARRGNEVEKIYKRMQEVNQEGLSLRR
jgi:hypothetical protein